MNLLCEEVSDRRKVSDGLGGSDHPFSILMTPNRFLRSHLRKVNHANLRVVRGELLKIGVIGCIDGPLHIGLTGTDPHLANQDIFDFDGARTCDLQCVGPTDGQRWDLGRPVPLRVCTALCALVRNRKSDRFTRVAFAPYFVFLSLLQNHMVGENVGKLYFCINGLAKANTHRRDGQ